MSRPLITVLWLGGAALVAGSVFLDWFSYLPAGDPGVTPAVKESAMEEGGNGGLLIVAAATLALSYALSLMLPRRWFGAVGAGLGVAAGVVVALTIASPPQEGATVLTQQNVGSSTAPLEASLEIGPFVAFAGAIAAAAGAIGAILLSAK
ncbi:MAG: hypothetical protein ACRDMA_00295 [Solirubrobacterales bacterium]